ncbi:MAG: prepilin-type N-terminal cleavage/methylation domain-containing protein [Planctomycetaceae bacterium]|nr:prepilin-type N-terminal cleavage/methylation domain-containing protein [Planctomycetaceae bacterium]
MFIESEPVSQESDNAGSVVNYKYHTMHHHRQQLRFPARRQAFTLVELLVVCAIILVLALLTLAAVNIVAQSTKVAKTRATLLKLDTAMQQIFETYENKFARIKSQVEDQFPDASEEYQQRLTAHFIRDLMRMEMPQTWTEVRGPIGIEGVEHFGQTPLWEYYWREYEYARSQGGVPSRAALFFLIIQNLNPEALEAFHSSEVVRNDTGMLEFVDAWGNPIQFLRWAPALTDSDLQQNVVKLAGHTPVDHTSNRQWWRSGAPELFAAMSTATNNHPDPTDEREESIGWFLYPLIYSAGPDGEIGFDAGDDWETAAVGDEDILDPFFLPFGMPDGTGRHFDNIHNHQWYR